ncbi:MAG: cyclic nucleotide-binding domain-containing protein [Acidimicrobiia bacterium]|nr:cyclic nucleotide-binding domain-containing protein [Acidimicrobiia bacterium]
MTILDRLDEVFSIHDGERKLVMLLFLQYFCMGFAAAFTQATAFALFLTRFSADKLPVIYIAMAVVITLLTLAYNAVGERVSFSNRLKVGVGGQLVITVGFSTGLAVSDASWLIFALPILFQIIVLFGNLTFWSLAGRILNVRQGKRLFGFIGAGQWLAIVIFGFLMPPIVSLLGLANLLWLAALGVLGMFLVMSVTLRTFGHLVATPTDTAPRRQSEPDKGKSARGQFTGNRYIMSVFALTLLWWVGFYFLDNIFYAQAGAQYPGGDELAGFLGIFLGVLGVVTLFSNFFVSGRVMGRFGLRTSLLVLPVGLTIGTAALVVLDVASGPLFALFVIAVLTKMWGMGVGFSLDLSARSVVYQPLPAALRTRVQTFADGIIQPLAIGVAGVAMLAITTLASSTSLPLSVGLLLVSVALLALAMVVGAGYRTTLVEALGKRRLATADLVVSDAASVDILREGLHGEYPGAVMYSMRMLAEVDQEGLVDELPTLLKNEHSDVRRYALDQVHELRVDSAIPAVRECLADETSPAVAAAALRTLAYLGDVATVLTHADTEDPETRVAAIAGLLNNPQLTDTELAAAAEGNRRLAQLVEAESVDERAMAARVLGECGAVFGLEPLAKLMADPDASVRREALRAAGRVKAPQLWVTVIEALTDRSTRSAATSALVAGGESALSQVARALAEPGINRDQMIHLIPVCERIGAEQAIEILVPFVGSDDAQVRSAALGALSRCGYREEGGHDLTTAIHAEASHAAWLSAASGDVAEIDGSELLQSALAEEVGTSQGRVLSLLSFHGDAAALRRAAVNLEHGTGDKVAYALEIIDIETPRPLRSVVLSVMDDISPEERLERLARQFPQEPVGGHSKLAELAANRLGRAGSWTQACALHTAGVIELSELATITSPLVDSPSELVSEIAAWLQQAHPSQGERAMLSIIEKVLVLRNAGIFAETSDEILSGIAAIASVRDVAAGETIIEMGDAGDTMFVIASGVVKVHNREHEINQLGTGGVFGEMALLDPEVRSASVTAIEETQLLSLDQQSFFDLIDERPEVARGLLKLLTRRLRGTLADLAEMHDRVSP